MLNANKILQLLMLFVTAQMAFAEADIDYLMLAQISSDDAARRVVRGKERVLDVKKVVIDKQEIDGLLITLDGTADKSNLGSNVTIPESENSPLVALYVDRFLSQLCSYLPLSHPWHAELKTSNGRRYGDQCHNFSGVTK